MKIGIKDLLEFIDSPDGMPSDNMAGAVSEFGKLRIRVVAIKILSWLKTQHKTSRLFPLDLNDRYEWCRDFVRLYSDKAFLPDILSIDKGAVVLSADLSTKERDDLLKYVDASYRPPLMS